MTDYVISAVIVPHLISVKEDITKSLTLMKYDLRNAMR
jgi:hypothetical protein